MRVTEPVWYAWLHFRRPRSVSVFEHGVSVDGEVWPIESLTDATLEPCRFPMNVLGFERLSVEKDDVLAMIVSGRASSEDAVLWLKALARKVLSRRIKQCESELLDLEKKVSAVYRLDRYVRFSQLERLQKATEHPMASIRDETTALLGHRLLPADQKPKLKSMADRLRKQVATLEPSQRDEHNKQYMSLSRSTERDFFATVENKELTDDQTDAALVFEDCNLAIAGAGSGKSSCIVAKIGFVLKSRLFNDAEILALAYNRDAAEQLAKRIQKRLGKKLGRRIDVESRTFHSFGLETMVKHHGEGYRPKVLKEEGKEEGRFLKTVIANLVANDEAFRADLARWMLICPVEDPQPMGIGKDLQECERIYEKACRDALKIKRKGFDWRQGTVPTLDPDRHVRSLQERAICNWLILRGVPFEYERPDFDGGRRLGLPCRDGKQVPYKPDFTYQGWMARGHDRVKCRIVHEHFALDEKGRAPDWMGGDRYVKHVRGKRAMFEELAAANRWAQVPVVFIETHSAHFRDGSVFEQLEGDLKRYGVKLEEPRQEVWEAAISSFREFGDLEALIADFVLSFKECGLTMQEVRERAARSRNPYRASLFLNVAFRVFDGYQAELRAKDKIDYADMLREAISVLRSKPMHKPIRFVLVDEFQDISLLRARLVKSILDHDPEKSIVFCVGDDWQTINRFSGSDIEVFKNAGKFFGREMRIVKLGKTFRCPQGIADVSKALVMRNVGQIDKDVKADDPAVTGTIRVVEHGPDAEDRREALLAQLRWIVNDWDGEGRPKVYILRRTEAETTAPDGLDTEYLAEVRARFSGDLDIELMSVHGSKGLEAEYVVLPGLDSGFRGFPDERPPEWLLDLVRPELKDPLQEERRLFYVGLTRAIRMAIVLTSAQRPSEFVQDLEELRPGDGVDAIEWVRSERHQRIRCPRCRPGSLIPNRKYGGSSCSRQHPCGYREVGTQYNQRNAHA